MPPGDAASIDSLKKLDMLVSCQGGDYTKEMLPALRKAGFKGLWVDAASTLRMDSDTVIILDPLNRKQIDDALRSGVGNYIGGNCTVSLMLMAATALTTDRSSGSHLTTRRRRGPDQEHLYSPADATLGPASPALRPLYRRPRARSLVSSALKGSDLPRASFRSLRPADP